MQKPFFLTCLILIVGTSVPGLAAADSLMIADFSGEKITAEVHEFNEPVSYALKQIDGRSFLHAECDDAASGLFWRRKVNLDKTPWLHWSWMLSTPFLGLNERSKAGDDFAARVYVVKESRFTPWRSMAINYVWSGSEPLNAAWPNAYTDRAQMLAVRSGPAAGWQSQSQNVKSDFKRLFGQTVSEVEVVAVMTDCDDANLRGSASYDDIYFSNTP